MIKGYFIGKKPNISGYTLLKVLAKMDVLSEESSDVKSTADNPMEMKSYFGEDIRILVISKYPKQNLMSLLTVCAHLRTACPQFFQYFEHNDSLLLVYPIHPSYDPEDEHSENVWDRIIEELLRITLTGMMRDDITDVTDFIRTYINTFIKWN